MRGHSPGGRLCVSVEIRVDLFRDVDHSAERWVCFGIREEEFSNEHRTGVGAPRLKHILLSVVVELVIRI